MTENDLLAEVIDLARAHDVLWFHDYSRGRNRAGLPDLLLIGKWRVMWVELKAHTASTFRPDQVTFKWRLKAAGQDWRVWYIKDLASGHIADEIEKLAAS